MRIIPCGTKLNIFDQISLNVSQNMSDVGCKIFMIYNTHESDKLKGKALQRNPEEISPKEGLPLKFKPVLLSLIDMIRQAMDAILGCFPLKADS